MELVQCIAILSFISKGKCPIYDQFAEIVLAAIENGLKPPQKLCRLVSRIKEAYIKRYWEYENKRKTIFKEIYFNASNVQDCSLDCALWIYGYLFKDSCNNTDNF